jgi:hypothetical protein
MFFFFKKMKGFHGKIGVQNDSEPPLKDKGFQTFTLSNKSKDEISMKFCVFL